MGVIHPLPKGFADMPINEALFAAMKAASFVKPNARKSYRLQRMAEELIARAAPANPKCRVDDATAAMPDGHALPLRVFTPVAPYGAPPPRTDRTSPFPRRAARSCSSTAADGSPAASTCTPRRARTWPCGCSAA